MKKPLYLVDDIKYIESNCFQHQLYKKIKNDVDVIELKQFLVRKKSDILEKYSHIISVLKLRTLIKNVENISNVVGLSIPFVIYDQDPWESYRKNSIYAYSYERIAELLNVKYFATTSEWWAKYIRKQGHSARFVNMWVLPEYCDLSKLALFDDRKIELGFIGTTHGYRKDFFEKIKSKGINIEYVGGSKSYSSFLNSLSTIKIFLHTTDSKFELVDNTECNLSHGLWVKDIEAASQGCFSIRNSGAGFENISCIPTIKTFESIDDIRDMLDDILRMQKDDRQATIDKAINIIKEQDRWQETANILLCRG